MTTNHAAINAILEGTTPNTLKVMSSNTVAMSISQHEIGIHPKTAYKLYNILHEGPVHVLGKRMSQSVLMAKFSKELKENKVYLNKQAMINLRLKSSDMCKIYGVEDMHLYSAHIVTIAAIKETLKGIDGDIFKSMIEPYFEKTPLASLSKNSVYKIKAGIKSIEIKVVDITSVEKKAKLTNGRFILPSAIKNLEANEEQENTEAGGAQERVDVNEEVAKTAEYCDTGEISVVCGLVTEETGIVFSNEISRTEIEKELNKVGYEDVGGNRKQMAMIREVIKLSLHHPDIYTKLGIKAPKGILLHGPPGTGKTMIAKAIANESGAFLLTINGPEIMSKLSGESENNLRKAFETAAKNAPAIIFIDELDSLAPARNENTSEGEKRIVSQLLTLMDGMNSNDNTLVIGATNRPNAVDGALRRFGRFNKEVEIGVPDEVGRLEILGIHTRDMKISSNVDIVDIAKQCHGFTGSDIAAMCHEAAIFQLNEKLPLIDLDAMQIPSSILATLEVDNSNFKKAINNTVPSSLRETVVESSNVKWDDVGGHTNVKQELKETVTFPIKYPEMYLHYGQSPSTGVLLYGPPGCGKTLLAKAIATECGANFIAVKGPEFLTKWVGGSEQRVRETFDKARGAAPCVLFFDEIDSIGKARSSGAAQSSQVHDNVLNAMLVEMDGISSKKDVFVIGATNRPNLLDSALMRPGRLDQLIYISLPDRESRKSIFKAKLKNTPLASNVNINWLVERTEGYSGADIAEICQRAVKLAIRESIIEREKGDNSDQYREPSPITMNIFVESMKNSRKSVTQNEIKGFEAFARSMNVSIDTSIDKKSSQQSSHNADADLY